MYKHLGCDCICIGKRIEAKTDPKGNTVLYVDDEGLLKDHKHHFRLGPRGQWLAGRGFIMRSVMSIEDGEPCETETDHQLDAECVRKVTQWLHGDNPTDITHTYVGL